MAKGRMISRTLSGSRKLALCPEIPALVYLLSLPFADRDGLLETDDETLLDVTSRYGRARGWDVGDMAEARLVLTRSGLWETRGPSRGEISSIVGFLEHNSPHYKELPTLTRRWTEVDPTSADVDPDRDQRRTLRQGKGSKGKEKAKDDRPTVETPAAPPSSTKEEPEPPTETCAELPEACAPFPESDGPPAPLRPPLTPETRAPAQPLRAFLDAQLARVTTKGPPTSVEAPEPENVAQAASLAVCPVEPTDETLFHLRRRIAKVYLLPEVDARVSQDAKNWASDPFTLNAAVQLLERLEDPEELRKIQNPVGFMRKCVPDRAEELKSKRHTHIENSLDAKDSKRHASVFGVPRPYDPTE